MKRNKLCVIIGEAGESELYSLIVKHRPIWPRFFFVWYK